MRDDVIDLDAARKRRQEKNAPKSRHGRVHIDGDKVEYDPGGDFDFTFLFTPDHAKQLAHALLKMARFIEHPPKPYVPPPDCPGCAGYLDLTPTGRIRKHWRWTMRNGYRTAAGDEYCPASGFKPLAFKLAKLSGKVRP